MEMNGTTTVRELLAAHPAAVDILLRHGMCASCRADPPPVPLNTFAAKHCGGDLQGLIEEIQQIF